MLIEAAPITRRLQAILLEDTGDVVGRHIQFSGAIAPAIEFLGCDGGQFLAKLLGVKREVIKPAKAERTRADPAQKAATGERAVAIHADINPSLGSWGHPSFQL